MVFTHLTLFSDRSLPPSMQNCEPSQRCWKRVFWKNKRGAKVFKIRFLLFNSFNVGKAKYWTLSTTSPQINQRETSLRKGEGEMEAVLFRCEHIKSKDFFSSFQLSGTNSWPRGSIYCRRKLRQQQRVKKGGDGEGRLGCFQIICWNLEFSAAVPHFQGLLTWWRKGGPSNWGRFCRSCKYYCSKISRQCFSWSQQHLVWRSSMRSWLPWSQKTQT